MGLILNIDTALSTASICLAMNGEAVAFSLNNEQKDHARWLHIAIRQMLEENNYYTADLNAVAVSIGPGSFTGLRVSLSAAKGICYALNIPLISINTLELLAYAVKEEAEDLIVPLIDARRMEVYTAVYDKEIREKISPYAMLLEPGSFSSLLASHKIIFCGDGCKKLQPLITDQQASFTHTIAHAGHLAPLSWHNFVKKQFASLAYSEPLYVKDFHRPGE